MALVPDQKFSTFQAGGTPTTGDIIVGLRGGINTKFNYVLPGAIDSITGTANQVLVDGTTGVPITGAVTLSTPQDIAATSTPTFAAVKTSILRDTDGNITLALASGPSSVNYFTIVTNNTGGGPALRSTGADTDIPLIFISKGIGAISLSSASTTTPIVFNTGTTFQHTTYFNFANTLGSRTVTFQDSSGTVAYLSDIPGGSPSALTKTDDTNVTLTLGGTPATALLQPVSLTLGWTGTLSGSRGGTGVNNGASTLTLAGNLATSGAFSSTFTMTGATSVTFPTSGTLATTSQIPTGAALTKTDDTNVTLTLGGTPTTALLQATSLTLGWTGLLSGTRGGTGVNNGSSTFTMGGSVTFSGAFTFAGTVTGNTAVTFPTSGTLATTSQLVTPAALTKTDDTNVTLTLGGSPSTALVNAASLTLGWTGQLGLTRGGTAASLTASNGGIVYSTASALAILAGTATANQILMSGASTTPAWSTATYPSVATGAGTILRADGTNWVASTATFANTYAVSTLLYASASNAVTGLATANSAALVTNSTGVPAWSGTMTNGQVIIGSTGATPTAATLTAGSGITISNGAGTITISSGGGGMSWSTVSGTTQAAAVNNGYITNNAGAVTVTLPTTFAIGDTVVIKGLGAGGWVLAAGTATTIRFGTSVTSSAGSLTSANQYDTVKVTGLVANTTWSVDYALSAGLTVA